MGGRTKIGLFSLADHLTDPITGAAVSTEQRLTEIVEQGVLAERVGFERFAVGEHHFCDYILPNPALVLAAIAARTSSIRLFTTVTLLALHDTIQLAEDIAVLDNLSGGRLELSFARGVSDETSRAFGMTREQIYHAMAAKLDALLCVLSSGEIVTESGSRVSLSPRPIQVPCPVMWIGGGLSEESCEMAARRGLPLILPSLFRYPEDYLPIVEQYRSRMGAADASDRVRVGLPSYCWVGKTSQQAKKQWRPRIEHYVACFRNLRQGFGRAMDFDSLLRGPAICGSPAEVVDRLCEVNELLELDTHILLMDVGGMPYAELRESMELMGNEVLPYFNGDRERRPAPPQREAR